MRIKYFIASLIFIFSYSFFNLVGIDGYSGDDNSGEDFSKIIDALTYNQPSMSERDRIISHVFNQNLDNSCFDRAIMDENALKELHIFTGSEDSLKGSLLEAIDLTRTSFGANFLKRIMANPTSNISALKKRQEIIGFFVKNPGLVYLLEKNLNEIKETQSDFLSFWHNNNSKEAIIRSVYFPHLLSKFNEDPQALALLRLFQTLSGLVAFMPAVFPDLILSITEETQHQDLDFGLLLKAIKEGIISSFKKQISEHKFWGKKRSLSEKYGVLLLQQPKLIAWIGTYGIRIMSDIFTIYVLYNVALSFKYLSKVTTNIHKRMVNVCRFINAAKNINLIFGKLDKVKSNTLFIKDMDIYSAPKEFSSDLT